VHHKAGCNLNPNAVAVKVDLWVCVPTASAINTISGNTRRILHQGVNSITIPLGTNAGELAPGGSATMPVEWRLPNPPTNPAEGPGHKCLIARAYPNTSSTNETTIGEYAASLDPHYAQRNICIQTCNSPCGQEILAFQPIETERDALEVEYIVYPDFNPSKFILQAAEEMFLTVDGLRHLKPQIAVDPPTRGFELELVDVAPFTVINNSIIPKFDRRQVLWGKRRRHYKLRAPKFGARMPFFRAAARLKRGQDMLYRLHTDLEGAAPGTAQVFHVMESVRGWVRGGLTVIMVEAG
jgi:hypothetical protein